MCYCVIQSVSKNYQYCIELGPLMDVWLRWNHQPAVIILLCFLERLASMKSSACGQYYSVSLNVWLRWNHQPAVNIMVSFLERLALMKSSACGQYYALVLVSLRWNNSIYLVYNILCLLQSVSKTISIIMSVYGKIY